VIGKLNAIVATLLLSIIATLIALSVIIVALKKYQNPLAPLVINKL
jgi:hypothetical protein